jgi:hypothetical protein
MIQGARSGVRTPSKSKTFELFGSEPLINRVAEIHPGGRLLGEHEVELQFDIFELRLRNETPT